MVDPERGVEPTDEDIELADRLLHRPAALDMPPSMDTPGKRAIYYHLGLGRDEKRALAIHKAVLENRNDGWRGHLSKENVIKKTIWDLVQSADMVEHLFTVIKGEPEY